MLKSMFSYKSPESLSNWEHSKRRIKQLLPGDKRRIHVYNVGIERTGTHYIAQLFAKYRARHEPDIPMLLPYVVRGESPSINWLLSRDRALRLEVESSHVVGHFTDRLVQAFPKCKFICTVREPVSWVRSVWRWAYPDEPGVRVRKRPEPSEGWKMWHSILKAYYEADDYQSEILMECGLYPLQGYFLKYRSHYSNILTSVPSDRLLLVRTSSLFKQKYRIAHFLNVNPEDLSPPPRRVNQSKKDPAPFDDISDSYIQSEADKYLSDVWKEILKKSE